MFDTKKEKYAYVQGLRAGVRGKKPFAKGAPRTAPKSYPKSAAKTKPFNQMSKSEQIRATERMKKAEYKRYLDDLLDVDRSLYLGMDDRGK